MKIYTIIGGVNGVGKSSLTGVLKEQRSDLGIIIDADALNAKHGGDRIKGGKEAVKIIGNCLEKSVSFTQETTLSGGRTLRTVLAAKEKDYFIRLYYVGVNSSGECLSRIANRVKKGGHDIPEKDVRRRFEKRFEDLALILPHCNEAHFYDNENGFAEVGEYRGGELIIKGEYIPKWLKELNMYLNR